MAMQRTTLYLAFMALAATAPAEAGSRTQFEVKSADGTLIAYECSGSGPELLIVHGGTGDRTRWIPTARYLEKNLTVCLMDRRGHGESRDSRSYNLAKEAEDVAAVVEARGRPVVVMGHSFGAVTAFEAAFISKAIAGLILYEPPLRVKDATEILARMESLIQADQREKATELFMREIVLVSPDELSAMRERPTWKGLVASIGGSVRQHRALMSQEWNESRVASLQTPTLVLMGEKTTNDDLRYSATSLAATLPHVDLCVLPAQEHNAMDDGREGLAKVILAFVAREWHRDGKICSSAGTP